MIFWDTSALVPLLVDEPNTARAEDVAREDGRLLVWWGTSVEILSALARRERDGDMSIADADTARETLEALADTWSEVLPSDRVRDAASRLLLRHPLRAADALQLGAATIWARGRPESCSIFTFDERMSAAARREGFDLIGASSG